MENVVLIIDDISNVLISEKEPLDPSNELSYPELTVIATKTDKYHLQSNSFQTPQGALIMPDANALLGEGDFDCINGKVCTINKE